MSDPATRLRYPWYKRVAYAWIPGIAISIAWTIAMGMMGIALSLTYHCFMFGWRLVAKVF